MIHYLLAARGRLNSLLVVVAVLAAAATSQAAAPATSAPAPSRDANWLVNNGIAPDANGVAAYLRRVYADNAGTGLIDQLIKQLGADRYQDREDATQRLLAMATIPDSALRAAAKSDDAEIRTRAEDILRRANFRAGDTTMLAALRLIQSRGMKGLAAEVLDVAGVYPDPRIQRALSAAVAATAGPKDADLLRKAIKGNAAAKAGVAVAALPVAGADAAEIRALLDDPREGVRLAAARILADTGDRACLAALVRGLSSEDVTARTESILVLRGLTGQKIPYSAYEPPDARKHAAGEWLKWVQTEGQTAKLVFPVPPGQPELGRTLLCVPGQNAVIELDADGNEVFRVKVESSWGCQGLPNGHRMVASYGGRYVAEYDANGLEVWKKKDLPGGAMSVQRLPNGNTLVACSDAQQVLEIKPDGSTAWQLPLQGRPAMATRLESGNTLVCLHQANRVVEIDGEGKEVWHLDGVQDPQAAQRLENGNTLVTLTTAGVVREYTPDHEVVWSNTDNLTVVLDAQRLPNGNVLAVEQAGTLVELGPDGKVISRRDFKQSISRVCRY